MAKLIDLTNKKFNKLFVIRRANQEDIDWYKTINKKFKGTQNTYWYCRCDCGKYCVISGQGLRSNKTMSCGCEQQRATSKANTKDETGKRYGRLLVIERANELRHGEVCWVCRCDCGTIFVVKGSDLRRGDTKSCGCLKTDLILKNELGNKYGKLTVIERASNYKDGTAMWKCQCDCGNITVVSGNSLRAGNSLSCGCIKSKGEQIISEYLNKNNINYKQQYTFELLKGNKNNLRFDFAIFNEYNKLYCLIEYQGEQHYKPIEYFGGEKQFQIQQNYDIRKEKFCKENNILLYKIRYDEDIIEKMDKIIGEL